MQATAGTIEDPNIQGHLLPMVAAMAVLGSVCRVNLHGYSSSLFRFGEQLREELRPGCITNTLCQTMIMGHSVDVEVFNTNDIETVNNLAALLMREIGAPERNAFMNTCYCFTVLLSLFGTFSQFGMFPLNRSQAFLFLAKERNGSSIPMARSQGFYEPV
jgi:hypothetical protein